MEGGSINTYVRLKPLLRADHNRNRSAMEKSALYGRDDGFLAYSIDTVSLHNNSKQLSSDDMFTSDEEAADGAETRAVLGIRVPDDVDPGLVHGSNYISSNEGRATPWLKFEFDEVFDVDSTQEQLFCAVARSRVVEALQGVNCTIFAYGQTGSGKTYTTSGGETFQDRGLIPRVIGYLFECKEASSFPRSPHPLHPARTGSGILTHTSRNNQDDAGGNVQLRLRLHISFTEIYNEVVYDLLDAQQRDVCIPVSTSMCVNVCVALSQITHTVF